MNRARIFAAWAPDGAVFSRWAKPVLFAYMSESARADADLATASGDAVPPADGATLVVLDLPGAQGVAVGLQLTVLGYRPVPLYNACPTADDDLDNHLALIDVRPILLALIAGAARLEQLPLPAAAPPAFLLDARRRSGTPSPGWFDNRSISLPSDFPSANFLLARGFRRALLVQESGHAPQADLAHTLRRWQAAGVAIEALALDEPSRIVPIQIAKPSLLRRLWHHVFATLGLKRSLLGGFGGWLPLPGAGG